MAQSEFPPPHPKRITNFSPSLANQLLTCQLRVGFARDPTFKDLRKPSTYSVLGTAAHAVTEAVARRRAWPDDTVALRADLEGLWDDEVERAMATLAVAWSPATPPPPEAWPGYALTRARTIRRAAKLLSHRKAQASKPAEGVGVEVELHDPQSGLFGRADRIERDGASTRVVDLKTGLNQDEATTEQRRQLLLYAVLVHRRSQEWPSSIAVEDASGNRYREQLDPDEAEAALTEAQRAVESFNEGIETGRLLDDAAPSAEKCRWCEFRVVCGPFWTSLSIDWGQGSALGSVESTGASDGGTYVSMAVESPTERAGTSLQISALPRPLPAATTRVAAVDWVGSPDVGDARAALVHRH